MITILKIETSTDEETFLGHSLSVIDVPEGISPAVLFTKKISEYKESIEDLEDVAIIEEYVSDSSAELTYNFYDESDEEGTTFQFLFEFHK